MQQDSTDILDLPALAYAHYVLARARADDLPSLRYFSDTQLGRLPTALAKAQLAAALSLYGDSERAAAAYAAALAPAPKRPAALRYIDYGSALRDSAGVLSFAADNPAAQPRLTAVMDRIAELFASAERTSTQEQAWLLMAAEAAGRISGGTMTLAENAGVPQTGTAPSYVRRKLGSGAAPVTIANRGDKPVWRTVSLTGVPGAALPEESKGYTVSRTVYRRDGTPADPARMEQGDLYVVVIAGSRADTTVAARALVVDLLPAGFEIEAPAAAGGDKSAAYPWLKKTTDTAYTEARDDRYITALDLGPKTKGFTLAYVVRAVTPGAFEYPATVAEDMYDPANDRPHGDGQARRLREIGCAGCSSLAERSSCSPQGISRCRRPRSNAPETCRRWYWRATARSCAAFYQPTASGACRPRPARRAALPADADRAGGPAFRKLHPGVDPLAALRAVGQLIARGHIVSGASTLTMQAVRLLERRPRTLVSKIVESGEALALERRLEQDDDPRHLHDFGAVRRQSRRRAAGEPRLFRQGAEPSHRRPRRRLLVALPRSPERLRPDRHPEAARHARDACCTDVGGRGHPESVYADARAEPVPRTRLAMPFHAPHLAGDCARPHPERACSRTTIDPLLQRQVEALLRRESGRSTARRRLRQSSSTTGNARSSPMSETRFSVRRAARHDRHGAGDPLARLGAEAVHLRDGVRPADHPSRDPARRPAPLFRRLLAERFRRPIPRRGQCPHGPAIFAQRAGGRGARPARPGASPRRSPLPASSSTCRSRQQSPALRWRWAATGSNRPISRRSTSRCRTAARSRRCAIAKISRPGHGRCSSDRSPPGISTISSAASRRPPGCCRRRCAPPARSPSRLAPRTGSADSWAAGYDRQYTIVVWTGRPDGTPMPGTSGLVTAAPVLFKIADLLGRAPADSGRWPPPPGALLVDRRELPPGLRRLRTGPFDKPASPGAGGPRILFPPDGATIAWEGRDLPLEATGGQGPLRWLADGKPLLPTAPRRTLYWQPKGLGFVQLTVIDAAGKSAHADIRLAP